MNNALFNRPPLMSRHTKNILFCLISGFGFYAISKIITQLNNTFQKTNVELPALTQFLIENRNGFIFLAYVSLIPLLVILKRNIDTKLRKNCEWFIDFNAVVFVLAYIINIFGMCLAIFFSN